MTRGLSANNLAAIAAAHIRPIVFVELVFDGGTVYLHNAVGNYVWGGQTWQGIGALGEISPIEEGLDLSPFGVTLKLNGLNDSLLSTALDEEVYNRPVRIYIGYLNDSGVLVADPQVRWSGSMDTLSISRGAENWIDLQCESDLRFFDRANGSLFTDEDQQRRYSGDLGFEYLAQMMDVKLTWGEEGDVVVPGTPREPRRLPSTPAPQGPRLPGPRRGKAK